MTNWTEENKNETIAMLTENFDENQKIELGLKNNLKKEIREYEKELSKYSFYFS